MPWTHDAATDEWVWVDEAAIFEPSPRLSAATAPAEPSAIFEPRDRLNLPDGARRDLVPGSDEAAGVGYADPSMQPPGPGPMAPPYQNEDQAIVTRWEREVRARGNEVRVTPVGTFEVDERGRIVSEAPLPYRTI